jgi:hypothetical protein
MAVRVEGTATDRTAPERAALDYDKRRGSLDERILACVGRALESIGGPGTQIVFWNLSVTQNLRRNDVVDRPLQFIEGLREILGEKVARTLEVAIIEEVRAEFGLEPPSEAHEERFADVVERANSSQTPVRAFD